jgi:CBS domain containing-hemolysin-like protein
MYIDFAHKVGPILFIIASIVVFSALLTGIETALLVISDVKILKLSKKGIKEAQKLVLIKKNMTKSVSSLVFMNNLVNIMGTTFLTQKTIEIFGAEATTITAFALTLCVILYAKIIPKVLGERYHEKIALISAPIVYFVSYLFTPLNFIIEFFVKAIAKGKLNTKIDEDDIKYHIKLAKEKGGVSSEKIDYLESIFNLTKNKVFDVMTPSTQLEYLNEKDNIYDKDIIKKMKVSHHSRIIVVGKDINEIRGYILKDDYFIHLINNPTSEEKTVDLDASEVKDDLKAEDPTKIKKVIKNKISRFTKSILVVQDTITVNDLLKKLQSQHQMIAIVKNKFGVTLGVVTLEDIIEQIIGEIVDETDKYGDLRAHGKEKFSSWMEEQDKAEKK